MPAKVSSKETISRKSRHESFATYIKRVSQNINPDWGYSRDAMHVINSMTYDIIERIAKQAGDLCKAAKKQTIGQREIELATGMILPGELVKHARNTISKHVNSYHQNMYKKSNKQISKSTRAGLEFPVGRITRMLKNGLYSDRTGELAGVSLAAAVEYVVAEIVELSINMSRDDHKSRITPRHIFLAIRADEELDTLFTGTIPKSGVRPYIRPQLLPKKTLKKN